MKVLAIADLHGAHETYSWLAELADLHAPDAVVLAGDLLGCPSQFATIEAAQACDAEQVLDALERIVCPVMYVMGNDDMIELPHRSKKIFSIHGRRQDLGRFNFVGYQYSLPFMGGLFEKLEEEIAADLFLLAPLVDESTVLVTHSPALGILDVGVLDRHSGSQSILDLIRSRRPRAHIHGHIHQAVGREAHHWNVGTYERRRAVLIDLDTLEDEVLDG